MVEADNKQHQPNRDASLQVQGKLDKQSQRSMTKMVPKQRRVELQGAVAIAGPFIDNNEKLSCFVKALGKFGQVVKIEKQPSQIEIQIAKLPRKRLIFVQFQKVGQVFSVVQGIHRKSYEQVVSTGDANLTASCKQHELVYARQVYGEGMHIQKFRLIFKNIPFKVEEQEFLDFVRQKCFVWELKMPKNNEGKYQGFAFATYMSSAHMLQALQYFNKKDMNGRTLIVDILKPKDEYTSAQIKDTQKEHELEEQKKQEQKKQELATKYGDDVYRFIQQETLDRYPDDDVDYEMQSDIVQSKIIRPGKINSGQYLNGDMDIYNARNGIERNSKDSKKINMEIVDLQQEMEKQFQICEKLQKQHQDQIKINEGKIALIQEEKMKQVQEQQEKNKLNEDRKNKNVKNQNQETQLSDQQQSSKNQQDQNLQNTVFIRNLHLDVTQVELQLKMENYGSVKSARIAKNKSTGRSKGIAFVEFQSGEAAQKLVNKSQQARIGESEEISLRGQGVTIDLAVSQDQARKISVQVSKQQSKDQNDDKNKRLTKEGHIDEGSSAWNEMSQHDKGVRKRAAQDKNLMLKSPNFNVSTTRILIRNVPKAFTEKELKEMCIKAVKERATQADPHIQQVKLLRDNLMGLKRKEILKMEHKGRGFIEFTQHDHALAALRQLNNNPQTAFGKERRPIVEFALDKVQVIKARKDRIEKQQKTQQQFPQRQQQSNKAPQSHIKQPQTVQSHKLQQQQQLQNHLLQESPTWRLKQTQKNLQNGQVTSMNRSQGKQIQVNSKQKPIKSNKKDHIIQANGEQNGLSARGKTSKQKKRKMGSDNKDSEFQNNFKKQKQTQSQAQINSESKQRNEVGNQQALVGSKIQAQDNKKYTKKHMKKLKQQEKKKLLNQLGGVQKIKGKEKVQNEGKAKDIKPINKSKPQKEKRDKLDSLAEKYTTKIFGQDRQNSREKISVNKGQKNAKKWYE